jgi:aminoglycoside 6-adenylyltransferase
MEEETSGGSRDLFLEQILTWAGGQHDLIALIMTGSRARPDGDLDEFADYDLEIFSRQPAKYTEDSQWMNEIAPVWVFLPLTSSSRGCPTRLIIFEGGLKVDFSILPAEALEEMASSVALDELYEPGYRVLIDKTGVTAKLPAPSYRLPARKAPSEAEFRATIDEFWFEAYHIPKYLRRGDLWVVKHRDWTMKQMLLSMLEWHASAKGRDVWDIGLRMREWAMPDAWERMHQAFGRFDAQDSWRSFQAMVILFRETARNVADALGYHYPGDLDEAISNYLGSFDGKF